MKVYQLLEQAQDKGCTIKRLSRDIFKLRGKIISPDTLTGYQQLYLDFETVDKKVKSISSDVSVDTLRRLSLDDNQKQEGSEVKDSMADLLIKCKKLLVKFKSITETKDLDNDEIKRILYILEDIRNYSYSITHLIQNPNAKSQMDLF